MIRLLAKWFIKDADRVEDPAVRLRYGVLCGTVGIVLNLLLFTGKLIAGTLARSIAVTADALNNLSDAGSSAVTLAGFRLSGRKADREHPFGHGRLEYVAGLIVSMLILLMGVELLKSSVEKILAPEPVQFSFLTVGVLLCSMLVKCYMALYNRKLGARIDSSAMRAASMDSVSDVAATGVVLLSTLIGKWTGLSVDGWGGVLVALFILYTGVRAIIETASPLLGQPPSKEFVKRVIGIVTASPEVVGMHDLVVHNYGPGRVIVSLHVEVPADGDILALHDTVDNLEKQLRGELGCTAVIHMDPVVLHDENTEHYHAAVNEIVQGVDQNLTIHDFRYVPGTTHTNLVFDLVVPYGFSMSEDEVKKLVCARVRTLPGNCFAVVEIDRGDME